MYEGMVYVWFCINRVDYQIRTIYCQNKKIQNKLNLFPPAAKKKQVC
jgi:hypothetical protein